VSTECRGLGLGSGFGAGFGVAVSVSVEGVGNESALGDRPGICSLVVVGRGIVASYKENRASIAVCMCDVTHSCGTRLIY